jgi:type IV pilus assembly protein PilW
MPMIETTQPMNQRGFTLIELMVALAVALLAMASIAMTFQMQFKTLKREEMASEMRDNVRAAVEMMTRELSMAGYDPSGSAGAGIVTAAASSARFTIDLDGDGALTGANEDIEYEYDSTDRTVKRNSVIIADNITGLSLTYYNAANSAVTTAGEVRRVRIQLNGRSRAPLAGGNYLTLSLSSDVKPWNLAF